MDFEILEIDGMKLLSSPQIAEVIGKQHKQVSFDIKNICDQINISIFNIGQDLHACKNYDVVIIESTFEGSDTIIVESKQFLLNEMALELLATGYDTHRRLQILRLIIRLRNYRNIQEYSI